MTNPKATSDQRVVTVVEISDPTDANAGVELLDQDAMQLQSIPMRVRRVIVRLESAAVVFHSSNLRVRTRTTVRNGLLGYVTFGPSSTGMANGLPVRPGLMHAVEPCEEISFVTGRGWESISFLLPPDDVRAHVTARQREGEFPQLTVATHFPVTDDTIDCAMRSVRNHVPDIGTLGERLTFSFDGMVISAFAGSHKVTQLRADVLDFGSLPVQQIYGAESVPKYHFENGLPDPYAQIDRTQEIQAGEQTYCRSGY